jgi:hypothetical protein
LIAAADTGFLQRAQIAADDRLESCQVLDAIAQQPLFPIEHLAAPERRADHLELLRLQLDGETGQSADDLRDTAIATGVLRKEETAVERAVRNRPGRESCIDLVDLLLRIIRDVLRRQSLQVRAFQRIERFDLGQVRLGCIRLVIGSELDVRRRMQPAFDCIAGAQWQQKSDDDDTGDDKGDDTDGNTHVGSPPVRASPGTQ